jgi:hypothetical protein
MFIPGKLCKKCQTELGLEPYVMITDKITRGLHTFHARCQPLDPDVRRHHGMILEPGVFGMEGKEIGSV